MKITEYGHCTKCNTYPKIKRLYTFIKYVDNVIYKTIDVYKCLTCGKLHKTTKVQK